MQSRSHNDPKFLEIERLNPQNPLKLIGFLLTRFQDLESIDQVYAELGTVNFIDVSSEEDAVQEWKAIGLTQDDKAYMLSFNSKNCHGEMEYIFRNNRLVQSGIQLFPHDPQDSFLKELFEVEKSVLGLNFRIFEVDPAHIMFSNNAVNGYLHFIAGLVFRIADLKWCESVYGPTSYFP